MIFVDTSFWLAIVNPRDKYHQAANEAAARFDKAQFVTTEAVLMELGNALAREHLRHLAVELLALIRAHPRREVLTVNSELFDAAVELYASRPDKEWGLVDCVSFVIMKRRGIQEVLTTDRHFEQAGFVRLIQPLD